MYFAGTSNKESEMRSSAFNIESSIEEMQRKLASLDQMMHDIRWSIRRIESWVDKPVLRRKAATKKVEARKA